MTIRKMGVLGGGAWGTALAATSARAGLDTLIWAFEPEVVDAINNTHENKMFLSGVPLDPALKATGDFAALADRDAVLMVCPAQHLRPLSEKLQPHLRPGVPVIICAKGIEVKTGMFLSDVLAETMPGRPVAVLSGPTFAAELARGLPSALTLATKDEAIGKALVAAMGLPIFRPYLSDDVIGAQIGGAVKNVMAIATGIVAGLKMGENARAALLTRGLAEMARFGTHFGAETETLMGLSGLGDLVLTCVSQSSRNMSLGYEIGEGRTMADIMAERRTVAEGAHTVEILHVIAKREGIDMPITEAVYKILKEGAPVAEVTKALLARPFTRE
ncbi:NAD(P)H-dependent glycerol-3-phosphate dehydrogenase [Gimibacter soli]|uniref:Glycerol-3-phosphate dehydrogenase [NAD(P)+] n=1 Tax=Gimibacter soli TaxID=3024400 RepID=A0AAE9XSX9_9PROT|nr:NAD(P)H-dependent glycerol-3-phosphate dehydrogenase [Gimibacter soli]WCL55807.1 NAD(P)-dependent glycerol-3-phosphate dehydrogenase [Gimibacter soli]